MNEQNTDSSQLPEFLGKKGVIGILAVIEEEDGNIQSEILERVPVDKDTLRERLKEAKQLHLVKQVDTDFTDDHSGAKRYQLTTRGKAISWWLKADGIDEAYKQLMDARNKIEEGREKVVNLAESGDLTPPGMSEQLQYDPFDVEQRPEVDEDIVMSSEERAWREKQRRKRVEQQRPHDPLDTPEGPVTDAPDSEDEDVEDGTEEDNQ